MGYNKSIFCLILLFLLIIIPVSALDNWRYYRTVTITNNVAQNLTDYQVSFILDTANLIAEGKMRYDCGDIRITLDDMQLLPYWFDPSSCKTYKTVIWTKVPLIPANNSLIIYVWYGNPQAFSMSDGDKTFNLFDDFLGSALNATKWATNIGSKGSIIVSGGWLKLDAGEIASYPYFSCSNCAVMTKAYSVADYEITVRLSSGAPNVANIPGYSGQASSISGYQHAIIKDNNVLINVANAINGNTIYILQLGRYGSNINFYRYDGDWNLQINVSASDTAYSELYPGLRVGGSGNGNRVAYFDWIAVRKYIEPEPSTTLDKEQPIIIPTPTPAPTPVPTSIDNLSYLAAFLFIFILLIVATVIRKMLVILSSIAVTAIFTASIQINEFRDFMLVVFAFIVILVMAVLFYERWIE
jgi:hypothetical protein